MNYAPVIDLGGRVCTTRPRRALQGRAPSLSH